MTTGLELLSVEEMRAADALAVEAGVPSFTLMQQAGEAVAAEVRRLAPSAARVLVVCGPGANGGDGFVAAARLHREAPGSVVVAMLGSRANLAGDAARAAKLWPADDLPFKPAMLAWADVIVDAMFGAGLSRPLAGEAAEIASAISGSGKPVLAVDVPSGLDGSTGEVVGTVAVQATRTVTFFRRKPGHLLLPGRRLCGDVALYDIAIPPRVLANIGPKTFANAKPLWHHCFPRPDMAGHKYSRGHAIVVSGGMEMSGAARLCARGALRIGAGLVTIAAPPDTVPVHAAQLNAILLKSGQQPGDLRCLLADPRFNAVAIGPGLGLDDAAFERVTSILTAPAAAVLDADAITASANAPEALFRAIAANTERAVVLTPHEGEFRRLFADLAGSKLERARQAAARSGAVVVLKGPDTVIAAPDGRAAINENAPPTLATAGSGDVLAGFVTGLLAQGMPAFEAAASAVWAHGHCAGLIGPGLIAEDLPEALPRVLQGLAGS